MASQSILVASLTSKPSPEELRRLSGLAQVLEVRADLLGDPDPEWLRDAFAGKLLYTLRSREEGGESGASRESRHRRLAKAAQHYDWVDLEGLRDAQPGLLRELPPRKRVVSWHGPPATLSQLNEVLEQLTAHEARYYKVVPSARRPHDEVTPLALLHSHRRTDLIAFATGPIGTWSRLIGPRLGANVVFCAAGEEAAAPGQPSLAVLREDYGLPELAPVQGLFGIVGCPVDHSLSPRLHNGIYRRLGLEALYLPFHVEAFGDFWLEVVESGSLQELGFDLKGLSVTTPHKEAALAVAGATSPLAERIGSANSLVCKQGVWEAETTDPEGVLEPLRRRGWNARGRSVAVLGAGGAGRAVAFALSRAGAAVCMVNRDGERGRRVARELGVSALPWADFDGSPFDLVVHATPLGLSESDETPFDVTALRPDAMVIDLVYLRGRPTALVREARKRGCEAVDGREVLLSQAKPQFELMTGEEMPEDAARELLGLGA